MKRVALSEPEGAPQRLEKAAKECDAGPELVEADPLLEQLRGWTRAEAAALRWQQALQSRDIWSLDDLMGLARDEEAWNAFHAALAQQEAVLASKLHAWRQPGNQWCKHSLSLVFSFALFVLLRSLFWPPRQPWFEEYSVCILFELKVEKRTCFRFAHAFF